MRLVRLASKSDAQSVLEITSRVRVFNPTEIVCVEELWDAYREKGESSGYVFLVCSDGEQVLGYACFGPHPLTFGTFDLYWIAVDPSAQGLGVGRDLLKYVELEVASRGGRLLLIETSDSAEYASARRLYECGGYHREALVHDFYSPGDSLLVYAKVLTPTAAWEVGQRVVADLAA